MKKWNTLGRRAVIALLIVPGVLSAQRTNGYGQVIPDWQLNVDCYHSEISNEGTNDPIVIEVFDSRGVRMYWGRTILTRCCPTCGDDDLISNQHGTWEMYGDRTPARIVITATGDDAAFIDELYLRTAGGFVGAGAETLQQWGRDDGRGWCVSTDPDDDQRSWRGYATCRRVTTFTVD